MRLLIALLVIGLVAAPTAVAENHTMDDGEDEDLSPTMVSAIVLAAFAVVCFLLARYGP